MRFNSGVSALVRRANHQGCGRFATGLATQLPTRQLPTVSHVGVQRYASPSPSPRHSPIMQNPPASLLALTMRSSRPPRERSAGHPVFCRKSGCPRLPRTRVSASVRPDPALRRRTRSTRADLRETTAHAWCRHARRKRSTTDRPVEGSAGQGSAGRKRRTEAQDGSVGHPVFHRKSGCPRLADVINPWEDA